MIGSFIRGARVASQRQLRSRALPVPAAALCRPSAHFLSLDPAAGSARALSGEATGGAPARPTKLSARVLQAADESEGLRLVNNHDYSRQLRALAKTGEWEQALALVEQMSAGPIAPNVYVYSILLDVLKEAGQWERALEVFDTMLARGVRPTVVTVNTLVSALGNTPSAPTAL